MLPTTVTALRTTPIPLWIVLGSLVLLSLATLSDVRLLYVAPALGLAAAFASWYRELLAWPALLAMLVIVILAVPIRRYTMPGNLPFEAEPYRLLVALIVGGWLASLLVDPHVRLRRSPFDGILLFVGATILGSVLVNGGRIRTLEVGDIVTKKLTFFASFLLIAVVLASVLERADVDLLVKTLVGGGAIVAALALIEYRTGYNAFNNLSRVTPFLQLGEIPSADALARGGRLRAYASAQHPIALGALLVMLLPFAVYLARRSRSRLWWSAGVLIALGVFATLSRTGVLMLIVIGIVFLCLRPRETKRLWPLVVPAIVALHLVLPGTIGTLKASFLPTGGLVAEQSQGEGGRGSGRIADLGPSLREFSRQPVLGQGFGTRVVDEGRRNNALILDNQWLGTLLETGFVGAAAWLWLFARAVRRLGRAAKNDSSADSWLLAALSASLAAFAVGMLTFDAFSFIQVTFVAFIFLGLGAALLRSENAVRPRRSDVRTL